MTGWGRLISKNEIFVGVFYSGMRNGKGTLYNYDGKVIQEGLWYRDEFVQILCKKNKWFNIYWK